MRKATKGDEGKIALVVSTDHKNGALVEILDIGMHEVYAKIKWPNGRTGIIKVHQLEINEQDTK